ELRERCRRAEEEYGEELLHLFFLAVELALDVREEHVDVGDERRVRELLLEGAELVGGAEQVALLHVDLAEETARALVRLAFVGRLPDAVERRRAAIERLLRPPRC